jgi:hypothetical protein
MPTTGVSVKNVFVGAPDQATTGAILRAPLGTALPATIVTALDAAFIDCGYISEDGLKLTPDDSYKGIKDWSGATIRRVLEEFNASLAWAHIETSTAALTNFVGSSNIAVTAPTVSTGTRSISKLNAVDSTRSVWAMKVKDGVRKVLIIVPDAQVVKREAIEFKQGVPIKWGTEIQCYPDANGNYVYIHTDDGVFFP